MQAKLSVSQPGDPQEKEADAVADKVMRNAEPATVAATAEPEQKLERKEEKEEEVQAKAEPVIVVKRKEEEEVSPKLNSVQRAPDAGGEPQHAAAAGEEKEEKIAPKSVGLYRSEVLQRSGMGPPVTSKDFESDLSSTKGQGNAMPDSTQQFMENRFNTDFSGVRIHTGSQAENLSRSINAQAFTHGNDIYFNSGKYSPHTAEGGSLLAHELTHTVQQGASPSIQKKTAPPPAIPPPAEVTSLTKGSFAPSDAVAQYIEGGRNQGKEINVSFGSYASGAIKVRKQKDTYDTVGGGYQGLPFQIPFLQPLVNAGVQPMLAVQIKDNAISGFMTVGVGASKRVGDPGAIFSKIKENPALMKWDGLQNLLAKKDNIINEIAGDKIHFAVNNIQVTLGGFVKGTFNIDLLNTAVSVEGSAIVTVKSLANGTLNFKRDAMGNLRGNFEMQAAVKNFTGSVQGQFLNGIFDIHGKVRYTTEKLSGEVNLIVTDQKQAKQAVLQQLEPQQISKEAEERAGVSDPAAGPVAGPRAIAGWGTVEFAFNKWLTGMAKVIIDDEGYVTVHGEITPPAEVPLFQPKPYRSPNFIDLHPTFRWGIPYVADLHVGLDFLLYAEAQIGPAVLRNIKIIGNYSTDPLLFNDFRIQATFNLMGYAGLVFEFGAHAGVGILGFDIDLKGTLKATAGIKGYVEATPVIGYREKADPVAGKKGEFFLSGSAELAAQPFLGLEGIIGLEVDSPWPIPNFGRSWNMFKKEYPLPGQFGVGLTFGEYILGSGEFPKVDFNQVNFDPDKFKDDLIERNVPPAKDHPAEKKAGFADKNQGKEPPPPPPPVPAHVPAANKGKDGIEKPVSPAILERWVVGTKAIKALKDRRDEKPETKAQLMAELNSIKRKFKFSVLVADPVGQNWSIYAEMPGVNNSGTPIIIKGLAEEKKEGDGKPVDKALEEKHANGKEDASNAGILALNKLEDKFAGDDGSKHRLFFMEHSGDMDLMINPLPTSDFVKWVTNIEVDTSTPPGKKKDQHKKNAIQKAQEIQREKTQLIAGGVAKNDLITHIKHLLDELSVLTGHLFTNEKPDCCVENDGLHFGGLYKGKYGKSMEAKYLTNIKMPQGSVPSVEGHQSFNTINQRRNKAGSYYVLGHLLNHNIGGTGKAWKNLTPLTRDANSAHESIAEARIKTAVTAGNIVYYKVEAEYGRPVPQAAKKRIQEIMIEEANVPTKLICEASMVTPASVSATGREQKVVLVPAGTVIDNQISQVPGDYDLIEMKHETVRLGDLSIEKISSIDEVNEQFAEKIADAIIDKNKNDKTKFASFEALAAYEFSDGRSFTDRQKDIISPGFKNLGYVRLY